jgi:hypothetical protein
MASAEQQPPYKLPLTDEQIQRLEELEELRLAARARGEAARRRGQAARARALAARAELAKLGY